MNHQNADRPRSHTPSRRAFLKTGALSAVGLGVGGFATTANGHVRTNPEAIEAPGQAKNIIFLVSDGMSVGTLTMADLHLRRHHDRRSHWIRLYEDGGVRHGLMDMASANSIVTGSAAMRGKARALSPPPVSRTRPRRASASTCPAAGWKTTSQRSTSNASMTC